LTSRRIPSGTILAVILVAVVLGWLAYIQFFNEERAIRRRMNAVAAALSTAHEGSDVARLSHVMQLRQYLAPDVHAVDEGSLELTSRDELLEVAARWATIDGGLTADFVDLTVTIGPGGATAESHFTARITAGDPDSPRSRLEVRDTIVELARNDGEWVMTSIDARKAN
jgi:ketosteroid isomerase-like protein